MSAAKELEDVLTVLESRGLLSRAHAVVVGPVTVQLGPPEPAFAVDAGFQESSDSDQSAEEIATMYGAAASGFTPGAVPHFEAD